MLTSSMVRDLLVMSFLINAVLVANFFYVRARTKYLLWLCENVADFRNGNTHDGYDEGQVKATEAINDIKRELFIKELP